MPILGWQSNFSEALIQVKKQQFNVKFWSWGPTTIWHNMTGVQFFSSKITPQSCTGPWQPWRGDPLHGGALIIYILYTRGRLLGSCRFPCPSWQFLNGKLYTVPKLFPSQVSNFLLEHCTLSQNYSEAPHKNESVTVWADASLYSMLYIKKNWTYRLSLGQCRGV